MLDESQWWPIERLTAWQRSNLASLLNHARSTVPFYRFRLNKAFRPSGAIDWDRWHEIPILTRAELSGQFQSLLSRSPIPQHGPVADVGSSGSTGHPVTVRTTRWLNDMSARPSATRVGHGGHLGFPPQPAASSFTAIIQTPMPRIRRSSSNRLSTPTRPPATSSRFSSIIRSCPPCRASKRCWRVVVPSATICGR